MTGHADEVHITSTQVSLSDLHAAGVDVTLGDVDLLSREIGTVAGTLTGVRVAAPNGDTVLIERVALSGPADRTVARCSLTIAAAEALAETQLAAQGVKAKVSLAAPNSVTFTVGGNTFKGRLMVAEDSLFLKPDNAAMPTVLLIKAGSGNPFNVASVSIDDRYVNLTGTLDVESLLS